METILLSARNVFLASQHRSPDVEGMETESRFPLAGGSPSQHRSPDVEGMETQFLLLHGLSATRSAPQPRCRGDGNLSRNGTLAILAGGQHRSPDVEGMETLILPFGREGQVMSAPQPRCRGDGNHPPSSIPWVERSSAPQPRCRGDGNLLPGVFEVHNSRVSAPQPRCRGDGNFWARLGSIARLASQHRSPDVEGMETVGGVTPSEDQLVSTAAPM